MDSELKEVQLGKADDMPETVESKIEAEIAAETQTEPTKVKKTKKVKATKTPKEPKVKSTKVVKEGTPVEVKRGGKEAYKCAKCGLKIEKGEPHMRAGAKSPFTRTHKNCKQAAKKNGK